MKNNKKNINLSLRSNITLTPTFSTFLSFVLVLLVCILSLSPVTLSCRIKGTWRQVFPEENGEIPGPRASHYMCSIGDQQVLMIGGSGGGNPNYYGETWLYDYKSNTWTEVECDVMPDAHIRGSWGEYLSKISKTRAIFSYGYRGWWMFDFDSLKWFKYSDIGEDDVGYRDFFL